MFRFPVRVAPCPRAFEWRDGYRDHSLHGRQDRHGDRFNDVTQMVVSARERFMRTVASLHVVVPAEIPRARALLYRITCSGAESRWRRHQKSVIASASEAD